MLLCFGLPPAAHEDDAVRAILASCLICARLRAPPFNLPSPAVGVALGDHVFCGVIGGRTRREYSIVGDSANIAARLMQHAKVRSSCSFLRLPLCLLAPPPANRYLVQLFI